MALRHSEYRVKFPIGLQPNNFAPLRPAVAEMVSILMIQVVNRPHVIVDIEPILQAIELKLIERLIEGQAIEDALIDQILFEVYTGAILYIGVILDDIDEIDDHLGLRAMQLM